VYRVEEKRYPSPYTLVYGAAKCASNSMPRTHATGTGTAAADTDSTNPMLPPEPATQETKHKHALDEDFSTPTQTKAVKTMEISSKELEDISTITSGITITTTASAAASPSDSAKPRKNSDASFEYFSAEEDGNNETQDDSADEVSPSLQDALASSAAYVGENVFDSPTSPLKITITDRGASPSAEMKLPSLLVPPLHHPNTATNDAATTSNTNNTETATRGAKFKPRSFSAADEESVGMMAQGLAWARRQREHRRRLYLQNQAEQQLAKIQLAQAAEKKEQAAAIANRGLSENTTFASLAKTVPKRGLLEISTFTNLAKSIPSPFAGGIMGGGSCGGSGDAEDEYDYEDAHDYEGDNFSDRYSLKTDRQFARDQGSFDKAAMLSKSGGGYTVKLDVSDEEPEEEEASWIPPVRVAPEPELERHPYVLLEHHMQQIAVHVLPRGIAYCQWNRLYSLARDGDSFEACLRLIHGARRTLLVVRTSRNAIFGGFADMPWENRTTGGAMYFGGPNACLFKVETNNNNSTTDSLADSHSGDDTRKNGDTVKCYKWSGANRYIQLCDISHKMLAFGGGGEEGAFGLCVEKDFERGSTGPCATFDNEPLCEQEDFEIVDMEIFGFLVGQF
jgi:hypothetical protein